MEKLNEPGEPNEPQAAPGEVPTVETFIASLSDEKMKAICTGIFVFFRAFLPGAVSVVHPSGHGFTVVTGGEQVARIHLGEGFLWLEAGPERIPTGKITDLRALEKVLKRLEVLLVDRLAKGKVKAP